MPFGSPFRNHFTAKKIENLKNESICVDSNVLIFSVMCQVTILTIMNNILDIPWLLKKRDLEDHFKYN